MGRAACIQVFRFTVALAIVLGLTFFYREALPRVNQTTVGFSFLLAILAIYLLEEPPAQSITRFLVTPPEKTTFRWFDTPALSPDATRLVFSADSGSSATS